MTGEVKRLNPRKLGEERLLQVEEQLYADDAWVEVPYAESDDEFHDMRLFATSPACGKASRDLLMALGESKPFRRFREALKKHPAAMDAWWENRRREAELRLVAFCQAMELSMDHPQFQRRLDELAAIDAELDAEYGDSD